MVGKVSERVLLREGLERTDNGMKQTSWPEVTPINQKNYYTEFMKRDDQILALRMQNEANRERLVQSAKDRDRALNQTATGENGDMPLNLPSEGLDISKVIVIHPGSQFLRIGFSTDVLPKTVPMCLATRYHKTESEECEARPRRDRAAEQLDQEYGEAWSRKFKKLSDDLKVDMRINKRKVLPNSKELVVNYNRRTEPEVIPTHNDPLQVEWTDVNTPVEAARGATAAPAEVVMNGTEGDGDDNDASGAEPPPRPPKKMQQPTVFYGAAAQRIPDDSEPKFRLRWPMQHGWLNEDDYASVSSLYSDFEAILTHAVETELGLGSVSACRQYSCVFVIPDLYDKPYVEQVLRSCMSWFGFSKVCFIQESYAATCGAGYSQGCVVDVGAQKTSIACVEDGLVVEDSRINLKYGGYDVTETFVKMLLYDQFPYQEINLQRRYDFLLAEELKQKHCTMNQAEISVQLFQFHLRVPNQPTRKYQFKTYDEVLLAPYGVYEPTIFDNDAKLQGRRKLIDRAYNAYDVDVPDDPVSAAQVAVMALEQPSLLPPGAASALAAVGGGSTASGTPVNGAGTPGPANDAGAGASTPSRVTQPFSFSGRSDLNGGGGGGATPLASKASSPAPDAGGRASTPVVPPPFVFGAGRDTVNGAAASPAASGRNGTPGPGGAATTAAAGTTLTTAPVEAPALQRTATELAAERDGVLPLAPLDAAIMLSIQHAAKGDERKLKDYLGSVMVVGGGAKVPHFTTYLEERLRARRADLVDRILVSRSARDMDEQVVVWKGASVFAKLTANDSWITPLEYGYLGARILHHKVLWQW